jgi:hypothetical protein
LVVTGFSTGSVFFGDSDGALHEWAEPDCRVVVANWLTGVASDSSAYYQRQTQAYNGGPTTVVRVGAPGRVFATKIDIPPAFVVSSVTLPQRSALVDEGLHVTDIAVGNVPLGLGYSVHRGEG